MYIKKQKKKSKGLRNGKINVKKSASNPWPIGGDCKTKNKIKMFLRKEEENDSSFIFRLLSFMF